MRKYTKDTLITFLTRIILFLISFVLSIIIAKILGPSNKGVYTLFLLIPGLLFSIMNFSINQAFVYLSGKNIKNKIEVLQNINFLNFILSVLTIIIGSILFFILKDSFFKNLPVKYFILGMTLIPLQFFNATGQALLRIEQNFKKINQLLLINNVFILFLTMGLFYYRSVIYLIGVNIISQIFLIILYLRLFPSFIIKIYIQKSYIKSILSYGVRVNLTNIITFLHYKIDIILINYFLIVSMVGYYSLAVNLAEKIWFISSSISYVLFPKIVQTKDNKQKRKITEMSARVVLTLSFVLGIILYFISSYIIVFLYSNMYAESILPFKILLIGIISLGVSRILSTDISARGFPEYTLYTKIFSLILNIVLNIIFIPKYGIIGAATATSISYTASTILVILIYYKTSKRISNLFFINKNDIRFIMEELR